MSFPISQNVPNYSPISHLIIYSMLGPPDRSYREKINYKLGKTGHQGVYGHLEKAEMPPFFSLSPSVFTLLLFFSFSSTMSSIPFRHSRLQNHVPHCHSLSLQMPKVSHFQGTLTPQVLTHTLATIPHVAESSRARAPLETLRSRVVSSFL